MITKILFNNVQKSANTARSNFWKALWKRSTDKETFSSSNCLHEQKSDDENYYIDA